MSTIGKGGIDKELPELTTIQVTAKRSLMSKFKGFFRRFGRNVNMRFNIVQKAKSIQKGSKNVFNAVVDFGRKLDRRVEKGIEQKSRTGITSLDNWLNSLGGYSITNSGGEEEGGSNGRYTNTKEPIETIDIKWLILSPFASKSYKHYQQYKPTSQKPPKSNDPQEEGKDLKEDYEENADAAEKFNKLRNMENSENKSNLNKENSENLVLRIYQTFYYGKDSSMRQVLYKEALTVKMSELRSKYKGFYIDKNGQYGFTIK